MAFMHVPYHLDQRLPDIDFATPNGAKVTHIRPDLPAPATHDELTRMAALYEQVAQAVPAAANNDSPLTVVSNDCTVSIGLAAGLQRVGLDPAVVWIDAHGDLQTMETSSSGYIGGMALRFLLGYRSESIAGPLGLRPPAEDRVMLVDARDLDPAEADYVESTALRRLPIADLTAADLPDGPLLVNFDLDTLDPAELVNARYQAPEGPELSATLRAVRTIIGTGRVAAFNIACTWDPGDRDTEAVRRRVLAEILEALEQS
jgi:arginase